ncbi:hypothetical protein ATO13_19470 [Stappia sp. 22II-S9-Z10]|nr:hypothetical protein ATO13_19470 [Stappia sp. 22II-S9-Z10]
MTTEMSHLVRGSAVVVPKLGAHPGLGNDLNDTIVRNRPCSFQDDHPAVQHVEGQMVGAADLGANRLVQDGDFLGAI